MTRYRKTFAEAYKDVYERKVDEKIQPFMISYSKDGKHAGFKGADSLPELQKMAANLRKSGHTIDKMGRNKPPVKEEYIEEIDEPKEVPSISKEKKPDDEEKPKEKEPKDPATLEKTILNLQGRVDLLKQKLENEKNKDPKSNLWFHLDYYEAINRILKSSSFKLNWILDPFMNSGSVGLVSKKSGRRFIGFESNQDKLLLSMKRINEGE